MKLKLTQTRASTFNREKIDTEKRVIPFVLVSNQNEGKRCCCGDCYIERLDVNGADTSNLRTFFKNHNPSVDSAIGRVENIRIENNELKADVVFGDDEESLRTFNKYRDGILNDVSIGYEIESYEVDESGDIPVITVTKFRIFELSAVGIGFDKGAGIRSQDEKVVEIKLNKERNMEETIQEQTQTREAEQTQTENQTRTAEPQVNLAEFMKLARGFIANGADPIQTMDLATRFAEEGKTTQDFTMAMLEQKREAQPQVNAMPSKDNETNLRSALTDAILLRAGIDVKNPHQDANMFRNYSLSDMVKRYLNKPYIDNNELVRAFVSSDFPNIMMNVMNKAVLEKWEIEPVTYEKLAKAVEVKDFKDNHQVNIGDIDVNYRKATELSKSKFEPLDDMGLKWSIEQYRKDLAITTKTIINDDMNMIMGLVTQYTESAKYFINNCYWEAVTNLDLGTNSGFKNYKLPINNKKLFDDANNNTISDDFSEDAFDKLLLLMQNRVNSKGQPLRIVPKTLIVPSNLVRPAKKIIHSTTDYSGKNYNPFENIVEIMYEPNLNKDDKAAYYLAANKMTGTIGFLQGTNKRPVVELEHKSFARGVEYNFSLAFGILLEDFRSFARGGK